MVIEKINLDLSLKMLPVTVKAKQGDRESRYIEASLFYDNLNYNIPPSATVLISYSKPDKKKVENTIEKENVIGNRVTFPLTEQMLTVAGIAKCDVKIINDNGIISTATFKVDVEPQAVPDDAVESTDEYNALIDALVEVRDVEKNYTPKLLEVERKIDSNTQAFNNAVANVTVDSEVITARSSGVKGKTFGVLDERLEDTEQDLISLKEDYANYQDSNNLKIATVEKELNDYKSTMANVNVNQEAKQTASGYGVVSLPKNSANGQVSVSVKGNTETDEEGNTKSTVSAFRARSISANLFNQQWELGGMNDSTGLNDSLVNRMRTKGFIKVEADSEYSITFDNTVFGSAFYLYFYDKNKDFISFVGKNPSPSGGRVTFLTPANTNYIRIRTYLANDVGQANNKSIMLNKGNVLLPYEPYTESNMYLPNVGELRSLPNGTKDEIRVSGGKAEHIKRIDDDGTAELASPIVIPINVSGGIVSNPSGTIYIEPVVADAGLYTDKLNVLDSSLPINYIEKLSKVDFNTGVETELDSSKCVVAEDKLSFTHPDLTSNDIVFFTYFHNLEGTQGETTIEYYDSRHTLKDSVTGKFYKVVPTVADGVLTNELVEV